MKLMEILKKQELVGIMLDFSKLRKQPLPETKRPIQYNTVCFFEFKLLRRHGPFKILI